MRIKMRDCTICGKAVIEKFLLDHMRDAHAAPSVSTSISRANCASTLPVRRLSNEKAPRHASTVDGKSNVPTAKRPQTPKEKVEGEGSQRRSVARNAKQLPDLTGRGAERKPLSSKVDANKGKKKNGKAQNQLRTNTREAARLQSARIYATAEAAQKESAHRAAAQAAKNRQTAQYIQNLAIARSNSEPFANVWQKNKDVLLIARDQAKSPSYRLQLESFQSSRSHATTVSHTRPEGTPNELPRVEQQRPPVVSAIGRSRDKKSTDTVTEICRCGGTNERCPRCNGIGYYQAPAARTTLVRPSIPGKSKPENKLTNFASDGRGDRYGIRENGKFANLPLHDDYGDDDTG